MRTKRKLRKGKPPNGWSYNALSRRFNLILPSPAKRIRVADVAMALSKRMNREGFSFTTVRTNKLWFETSTCYVIPWAYPRNVKDIKLPGKKPVVNCVGLLGLESAIRDIQRHNSFTIT